MQKERWYTIIGCESAECNPFLLAGCLSDEQTGSFSSGTRIRPFFYVCYGSEVFLKIALTNDVVLREYNGYPSAIADSGFSPAILYPSVMQVFARISVFLRSGKDVDL